MKAFAAVAKREIVEKRFVLAAALVAAVIPFAVPIVRGLGGQTARETRDLTAMLLANGISLAVAIGLGASVLAGELAARRMGFFMSRPISIPSLWGGKLTGALILVAASFGLILAPAALMDRGRIAEGDAGVGVGISAAALLLVFLLSNAVSTVARSRSALAAADLVMAGLVSLACASAVSRLVRAGFSATGPLGIAGAMVLAAGLLVASYRALAGGRTDLRAAHGSFSAALWAILVSASVLFAGYSVWAVHAPVSAISRVDSALRSGADGWVIVEGRARGLDASFLYDLRSGRSHRFRSGVVETSPDGKVAVWLAADSPQGPLTVTTLRLDDPQAPERETKVILPARTWPLIVSADGSRVAAVSGNLLSVYDLDSGRTLASMQIRGKDETISGTFVTPDLVRVLRIREVGMGGRSRAEVLELDVASRRFSVPGLDESLTGWPRVQRAPSGANLLMNEGLGSRVTLRDPRTLAVKAVLRDGKPIWSSAAFLSDGGVALGTSDRKTSSWAELFSRDGVSIARVAIGGPGIVRLGGEAGAGQLIAVLTSDESTPGRSSRRVLLIDWRQGSPREIARGLEPVVGWWRDARPVPPGSELAKAFVSENGELVRLDPGTGERRVLLGGR
ncbi:MAG: hypothetical protein M3167_17960 [Acidobacteriota bacterium]|nr:hypothetical protein [Acidobacteriota bacterium]